MYLCLCLCLSVARGGSYFTLITMRGDFEIDKAQGGSNRGLDQTVA